MAYNTFEGGVNGTLITTGNSGGVSGDAFTSVGGGPRFSNAIGGMAMLVTGGGSVSYALSGSASSGRFDLYLPTLSGGAIPLISVSGTALAGLVVQSSGEIWTSGAQPLATGIFISAGTRVGVEWNFVGTLAEVRAGGQSWQGFVTEGSYTGVSFGGSAVDYYMDNVECNASGKMPGNATRMEVWYGTPNVRRGTLTDPMIPNLLYEPVNLSVTSSNEVYVRSTDAFVESINQGKAHQVHATDNNNMVFQGTSTAPDGTTYVGIFTISPHGVGTGNGYEIWKVNGQFAYVMDSNHQFNATNIGIAYLAGGRIGFADGAGDTAKFQNVGGMRAFNGGCYILDGTNRRIRLVTPGGVVTTVIGNGDATSPSPITEGPALGIPLGSVQALNCDPDGNLYLWGEETSSTYMMRKYDVVTKTVKLLYRVSGSSPNPLPIPGPIVSGANIWISALTWIPNGSLVLKLTINSGGNNYQGFLFHLPADGAGATTVVTITPIAGPWGEYQATPTVPLWGIMSSLTYDNLGYVYGSIHHIVGNYLDVMDQTIMRLTGPGGSPFFRDVGEGGGGTDPGEANPPATLKLSSLKDTFEDGSIDVDKWTTIGPVDEEDGVAQLGATATPGTLRSLNVYDLDYAIMRVRQPGYGCTLWIASEVSDDYLKLSIVPGDIWSIDVSWEVNGATGSESTSFYVTEYHKYFKINRSGSNIQFLVSQSGWDWELLRSIGVVTNRFRNVRALMEGSYESWIESFNIPGVEPPPPEFPPIPMPDPGDNVPAKPNNTCMSALDAIREFSSAVKLPVRIVSPKSISIVPQSEPLPAGWTQANAEKYYTTSSQDMAAGQKTIALSTGPVERTGKADLEKNDVGIMDSGWDIPGPLPSPAFGVGKVKRFTRRVGPDGFTASVEFLWSRKSMPVVRDD